MKRLNSQLKNSILLVFCLLGVFTNATHAWQSDNGDGTYTNPPLYADFPDPDIIRVGEDFYFATTTFVNTPGLTIMHSQDLVNWEYVSHVIDRLDGRPEYDLQGGTAYRSGVFAPSLRCHKGTFYVVVTPVGQHTRIYAAANARGPWSYHELDHKAFDPGFFIKHFVKDMGIALMEAKSMNLSLPGLSLAHQFYISAMAQGLENLGTQGIHRVLAAMNGVDS